MKNLKIVFLISLLFLLPNFLFANNGLEAYGKAMGMVVKVVFLVLLCLVLIWVSIFFFKKDRESVWALLTYVSFGGLFIIYLKVYFHLIDSIKSTLTIDINSVKNYIVQKDYYWARDMYYLLIFFGALLSLSFLGFLFYHLKVITKNKNEHFSS